MSGLGQDGLQRDGLQSDGLQWLSVHLHFDGNIYRSEADRLLLDRVAPLTNDCMEAEEAQDWFFIRYAAEGSHLRLRLATSSEKAAAVRRRIDASLRSNETSLQAVRWIDYEPEIQRYGGEHAIVVAEALFCESSVVAVDLLRKIHPEDRASRLGKACLSMLVQLYVFLQDAAAAARLSRSYGTNYLSQMVGDDEVAARFLKAFESGRHRQADGLAGYVEAVWQALSRGEALTPEMDRYRQVLEATRRGLLDLLAAGRLISPWAVRGDGVALREPTEVLSTLFPSYLHMMNNRLGVTVQEECYLAVVIAATLESMESVIPSTVQPASTATSPTSRTRVSA